MGIGSDTSVRSASPSSHLHQYTRARIQFAHTFRVCTSCLPRDYEDWPWLWDPWCGAICPSNVENGEEPLLLGRWNSYVLHSSRSRYVAPSGLIWKGLAVCSVQILLSNLQEDSVELTIRRILLAKMPYWDKSRREWKSGSHFSSSVKMTTSFPCSGINGLGVVSLFSEMASTLVRLHPLCKLTKLMNQFFFLWSMPQDNLMLAGMALRAKQW